MEEGEGKDGDGCCTLDVQESICQGVSVLMIGSSSGLGSCDEAQLWGWTEKIYLLLGLHFWPLIGAGWAEAWV